VNEAHDKREMVQLYWFHEVCTYIYMGEGTPRREMSFRTCNRPCPHLLYLDHLKCSQTHIIGFCCSGEIAVLKTVRENHLAHLKRWHHDIMGWIWMVYKRIWIEMSFWFKSKYKSYWIYTNMNLIWYKYKTDTFALSMSKKYVNTSE
jgi:hypothetical protein